MARERRQDFPGAWHHVMNRGFDHSSIFRDDVDRHAFLTEVRGAFSEFRLELHGYCLMSTHYHLLVRSQEGLLSSALQRLGTRFSGHFNKRHMRDGPLFRGRFRSKIIGDDGQLVQTLRYIHRNPVEAGLAARATAWEWSSAAAYGDRGTATLDWLSTGEVRSITSEYLD